MRHYVRSSESKHKDECDEAQGDLHPVSVDYLLQSKSICILINKDDDWKVVCLLLVLALDCNITSPTIEMSI